VQPRQTITLQWVNMVNMVLNPSLHGPCHCNIIHFLYLRFMIAVTDRVAFIFFALRIAARM
jgi:hypothetical protein